MSVFKCKMCGGSIQLEAGASVGICDYCGTRQTLPRLDDERRGNLYDRANHFRRNNDFDKAMGIYEQILNEDPGDAEAYWSLVLCRYGIEYVEDPVSHKRVPTVNRAQFTSIFADEDYKSALNNADTAQKSIYEEEARAIDEIQKGILAISSKEEPFDVFICYKETDNNGRRTMDSVLANDLYHQLTQEGFKVFFSRITLEDKLGTAYEPYIFAALNSARVMVVLGTKPEHFNAVWVKNEWSRYLSLVKRSGGKKTLIPAFRDMDPYDLPDEFSHLQAQDMSKLGFMQDLLRGIKKLLAADAPKAPVRETVVVNENHATVAPLLERVFLFLEDGKWRDANIYCEKVLDLEPKNAEAYLGKLMAELQVRNRRLLAECSEPFDDREDFAKVIRFGDAELEAEMRGYIAQINERNEQNRLNGIYRNAVDKMNGANTEKAYLAAAGLFQTIPGFQDADQLSQQCRDKAEVCRKDVIYADAKSKMSGMRADSYEDAIKGFRTISGWRDTDALIRACQDKIAETKAKKEAERREAEEARIAAEKAAKKRKKRLRISALLVCACIAVMVVFQTVIIPNRKYKDAVALMEAGSYLEAIAAFEALEGYKDSEQQITRCETAILDIQYADAVALMEAGSYLEAIVTFEALEGYKDSEQQITRCETAILDIQYADAVALMEAGRYTEAIAAFEALEGYKDSEQQITRCETAILDIQYADAVALMEAGSYPEAIAAFEALDGYKDSAEKAASLYGQYKIEKLKTADVGEHVFFGAYEQDNNTANGTEYIEWLVLAKEENRVLVISEYALEARPYNKEYTSITWENCTLRRWLNEEFYNSAFTSAEQAMIPTTTVKAQKNPSYSTDPGKDTQDKVFLLSIQEVKNYFSSYEARKCAPTAYAKAQGAYPSNDYKTASGEATCWWWLRSPGSHQDRAADVYSDGGVLECGCSVLYDHRCVRPALWINLDS